MPGIPQERKWKLRKMYEAEGGGGPRLYIFKGVGLSNPYIGRLNASRNYVINQLNNDRY